MRPDQSYRTPSEVLDDVMDVDWNLMVNEVRVNWRQFQRTRIRNQSYAMAKIGKDPLQLPKDDDDDDYKELVQFSETEKKYVNLVTKRGQIEWTSNDDTRAVPTPEMGETIFRKKHKDIEDPTKFEVTSKGVIEKNKEPLEGSAPPAEGAPAAAEGKSSNARTPSDPSTDALKA